MKNITKPSVKVQSKSVAARAEPSKYKYTCSTGVYSPEPGKDIPMFHVHPVGDPEKRIISFSIGKARMLLSNPKIMVELQKFVETNK